MIKTETITPPPYFRLNDLLTWADSHADSLPNHADVYRTAAVERAAQDKREGVLPPKDANALYAYLDRIQRRPVWQEAAIWLISNVDVGDLVAQAVKDWGVAPVPGGWIGGQLRNALPFVLDTLLGTSDNVDADPTGSLGEHFYPEEN